ncbi:hypothetical protein BH20VER3_BH20VER3_10060 [soil metagenome]
MGFSALVDFARRNARSFGVTCLFFVTWGALAGNNAPPPHPKLLRDGATIRCALPAGSTSFVFRMKDLAHHRSLTLVNENGAAAGEISIAVSDKPLVEDDPAWSTVAGTISFRHKQRFTLSLVGVEAEYVRLTVRVEARGRSL